MTDGRWPTKADDRRSMVDDDDGNDDDCDGDLSSLIIDRRLSMTVRQSMVGDGLADVGETSQLVGEYGL